MEKEGMKRSITRMIDVLEKEKLTLSDVITDQSSSVQTFMRDSFPSIFHRLDHWHVKKNVNKAMKNKGKRKAYKDLVKLIPRFNRCWYIALEQGEGDSDKMRE
ncbi:hypothetical protein PFISCL1PPCAC_17019, partial [Pristionchus fissidentatus]